MYLVNLPSRNIPGQVAIQSQEHFVQIMPPLQVKSNYLAYGMHTSIGPTRSQDTLALPTKTA
jgi:hypothetical protein